MEGVLRKLEVAERSGKNGSHDFHRNILNVGPNADSEELRRRYKRLAFACHPDKNPNQPKDAERAFKAVSEAFAALIDNSSDDDDEFWTHEPTFSQSYSCSSGPSTTKFNNSFNHSRSFESYYPFGRYEPTYFNGKRHSFCNYSKSSFGRMYEEQRRDSPGYPKYYNSFEPNSQFYRRRARYRTGTGTHHTPTGRIPRSEKDFTATYMSGMLYFMPTMFIVVVLLVNALYSAEPYFALTPDYVYSKHRATYNKKVDYYVKENFIDTFEGSIKDLEDHIEGVYVRNLENLCSKEKAHKDSNIVKAQYFKDSQLMEKLRQSKTPYCDALNEFLETSISQT